MRKLTDHIVSGDQAVQLQIEVTDEPVLAERITATRSPGSIRRITLQGRTRWDTQHRIHGS